MLTTSHLPSSSKRFSDGASWRVEIPSVEGPAVMTAVLAEAQRRGVPVHRISQGSGIGLLTDDEIRDMLAQGAQAGVEVCLFHHRAAWDAGVQAASSAGRLLDVYLEAPDDFGGSIRHHDAPELVRLAAPIYLKFGVRNTALLYPSGTHIEDVAWRIGVERVRRAQIALDLLRRG